MKFLWFSVGTQTPPVVVVVVVVTDCCYCLVPFLCQCRCRLLESVTVFGVSDRGRCSVWLSELVCSVSSSACWHLSRITVQEQRYDTIHIEMYRDTLVKTIYWFFFLHNFIYFYCINIFLQPCKNRVQRSTVRLRWRWTYGICLKLYLFLQHQSIAPYLRCCPHASFFHNVYLGNDCVH